MRARKRPYLPRLDRSLELFARLRPPSWIFKMSRLLSRVGDLYLLYLCSLRGLTRPYLLQFLLRLPVGRGGVINSPRSIFLGFFFRVESWAAAHGLYRCAVYRLLSEPKSTRLLNSISSRICRQNTQFNMYTTTSKQQKG